MTKQILIFGATGSNNVGDDILGLILQRMVQKTLPGANVLIRPQHERADIETSDLVVIGGGGLIYDATFENVTNYTSLILHAYDQGIPVYMVGMGVQYMVTEEAKEIYRDALRFVKAVSVRNDADGDYLINELGCRPDQVIYSRDLAFLAPEVLDLPDNARADKGERPRLAFSLADLLVDLKLDKKGYEKIGGAELAEQKESYMQYVRDGVGSLLTKYDIRLVCQAQEDVKLYESLQDQYPTLEMVKFDGIEGSTELINAYSGADVAVTGRYHGMIAGILAGVPTIGVSFGGHKIKKLIDDSFPSLKSQFYSMGEMVEQDIFAKLLDDKFVATLRTPKSGEIRRCMKLARKQRTLMKMIAGECAKM